MNLSEENPLGSNGDVRKRPCSHLLRAGVSEFKNGEEMEEGVVLSGPWTLAVLLQEKEEGLIWRPGTQKYGYSRKGTQ